MFLNVSGEYFIGFPFDQHFNLFFSAEGFANAD